MEREILRSSLFIPLSFAVLLAICALLLVGVAESVVIIALRVLALVAAIYQGFLWRRPPTRLKPELPRFTPGSIAFTVVVVLVVALVALYGVGVIVQWRD